jgi:rubrerythrin
MENFSIAEIIGQAIQTEVLGHQFYTQMADKFHSDEDLNTLFLDLAQKELAHKELFSSLLDLVDVSAYTAEEWEEISHYMRAIVESEFFLGKHKSLTGMERLNTVSEAVKFAIGFEKDTLLYFMELRDIVAQKSLLDRIIDEERSHIRWLSLFNRNLASRNR